MPPTARVLGSLTFGVLARNAAIAVVGNVAGGVLLGAFVRSVQAR